MWWFMAQPTSRRRASSRRATIGAVDDLVADLDPDAADEVGVELDVEVQLGAVDAAQRGGQPARAAPRSAARSPSRWRSAGCAGRRPPGRRPRRRGRRCGPRGATTACWTRRRVSSATLSPSRPSISARPVARPGQRGRSARTRSSGCAGHDAAEAEQLVLDGVEPAGLVRGGGDGLDGEQLDRVGQVARCGPARTAPPRPATSTAAPPTCSPSTARASPARSSPVRDGSVSARRSAISRSSSAATANRSSPRASRSVSPDGSASPSVSRAAARDPRLAPCRFPCSCLGALLVGHRGGAAVGARLELVEEAVDDPALPGVVLERLADDAAGEVGGQRADLADAAG